jgi:hypothetical protein
LLLTIVRRHELCFSMPIRTTDSTASHEAGATAWQAMNALLVALARHSLGASLLRLPFAVAARIAVCIPLAALVAVLAWRGCYPSPTAFAALTVCYATAGILWGAHAALRDGALAGSSVIEAYAPQVIDALLSSVRLGEYAKAQAPIAEIRSHCSQLFDLPLSSAFTGKSKLAAKLGLALFRRALGIEMAAFGDVLNRLENSGETHVSFESLRRCSLDNLSDHLQQLLCGARRKVELAIAGLVFVLLTLPAGVMFWT